MLPRPQSSPPIPMNSWRPFRLLLRSWVLRLRLLPRRAFLTLWHTGSAGLASLRSPLSRGVLRRCSSPSLYLLSRLLLASLCPAHWPCQRRGRVQAGCGTAFCFSKDRPSCRVAHRSLRRRPRTPAAHQERRRSPKRLRRGNQIHDQRAGHAAR